MFYDVFSNLCKEIGKSPSRAAIEMGINKGTVSVWKKKGTTPQSEILQKVADYFGVSVDFLLGNEGKKSKEDADMDDMIERLKNNPGMRLLFSKTKDASMDDINKVIRMLDIMKGTSNE